MFSESFRRVGGRRPPGQGPSLKAREPIRHTVSDQGRASVYPSGPSVRRHGMTYQPSAWTRGGSRDRRRAMIRASP
jgi:hypothetical protein